MDPVTKSMTNYQAGDIVLVSLPDSSGSMGKQRPALVIADTGDDDILLARITTQLYSSQFDFKLNDWQIEGLLAPSVVRLHKLATIEKRLISRKIGVLTPSDRFAIKPVLQKVINQI
jgi:mRNA interferase MazF